VQTRCGDASSQIGCIYTYEVGSKVGLTYPRLEPGIYFVFAETYPSFSGEFQLTVEAAPVPANDVCATAHVLDVTSRHASVGGFTGSAHDDGIASCGGAGAPDVVYQFTTTEAHMITATVRRDPKMVGFRPVLSLRSVCSSPTTPGELACGEDSYGTAVATVGNVPAGTYFVWVDGAGGSAGDFRLDVSLSPPTP
jgi:hypothetical protein